MKLNSYLYLKSLKFQIIRIGSVAKQHIQAVRKGNGPQRPVGWSQSVPWVAMGRKASQGHWHAHHGLRIGKSKYINYKEWPMMTNGKLGNHSKFKKSLISTANTSNQISSPLGSHWRSEGAALLKGLQDSIPQSSATPLRGMHAVLIPGRQLKNNCRKCGCHNVGSWKRSYYPNCWARLTIFNEVSKNLA